MAWKILVLGAFCGFSISRAFATDIDPLVRDQKHLFDHNVYMAWGLSSGKDVLISIIDGGFPEHEDLKDAYDRELSRDFNSWTEDASNFQDGDVTHATLCAGIVGARRNQMGIMGVAYESRIMGAQVFYREHDDGQKYRLQMFQQDQEVLRGEYDVIMDHVRAIDGSVAAGAKVILIEEAFDLGELGNGTVEISQDIYLAIKRATQAGVHVIVPAGNRGTELKYEATLEDSGAIFVSSHWGRNSNFGGRVDVSVKGGLTTVWENERKYAEIAPNSTSLGAATLAGIVALGVQLYPEISPLKLRKTLRESGTLVDVNGKFFGTQVDARLFLDNLQKNQ